MNFSHGLPAWCCSVAVRDREGVAAGAVYAPALDRLYTAERRSIGGWIGPAAGPGGDTDATFTIDEPGWHWLEIVDGRNDARATAPFTIRRTFTPQ